MTLPGISLPDDRYRRIAGFVLGALVGFTYAAVFQFGDQLALPGVPLYRPPFGVAGNLVLFAVGGGLLGLLAAWPRSGLLGTFVAAAVSAAVLVGSALISANAAARRGVGVSLIVALFVGLPFWAMLVPVTGVLRWVVSHDEEARRDHQPWYRRVWQPVLLLMLVGAVGLTGLYRDDARDLLTKTAAMIEAGQSGGPLPQPLADTAFSTRGQGRFELSWERDRIERYRIPRPGKNFDQHSVVVARFRNGWNLVCLYVSPTDPPVCRDMEVLPR